MRGLPETILPARAAFYLKGECGNSLAYLRQFCSAFARLWAAGEGKAKTESDQAETINHLHLQIFF